MATQKFIPASKKNLIKKQKLLELKQNMRSSLPVLNRNEIIKFRLPYHEAILYELHELDYASSEQFLRQLIEYQENFRKAYSPESAVYTRPRLMHSHKDIQILSNGFKVAESSHFQNNVGQEIDEFTKLAIFYGFGSIDWWWLGQQIFMQAVKLSKNYIKDDNRRKTVIKYLYGKFLLENIKNESNAQVYLSDARELAIGKPWRVPELSDEQNTIFIECNKLLYKILISMGKKIAEFDPIEANRLYTIAEKRAKDECNVRGQADALLLQGLCKIDIGDANNAILIFLKVLVLCNHVELKEKLCETNIYLALAYIKIGKSDEALKVLKNLLIQAEQREYYLNEGKSHMATPFLMKALHVFHELDDIPNREQAKNLAAISAGQELLPKYITVIIKCDYDQGFKNMIKIQKWKDYRELFWDEASTSTLSRNAVDDKNIKNTYTQYNVINRINGNTQEEEKDENVI